MQVKLTHFGKMNFEAVGDSGRPVAHVGRARRRR